MDKEPENQVPPLQAEALEHSEIAAMVAERNAKDNGVRIPLEDVIGV